MNKKLETINNQKETITTLESKIDQIIKKNIDLENIISNHKEKYNFISQLKIESDMERKKLEDANSNYRAQIKQMEIIVSH